MKRATDYYKIALPSAEAASDASPQLVLPTSQQRLREHFERFARYFLREMHFNGIQFEAAETQLSVGYVEYKAYLFHDRQCFVGASCFRFRAYRDAQAAWELDWVWLHPYVRRKRYLSNAWPFFVKQLGPFHVAGPLSPAMHNFMQKMGRE